MTSCTSSQGGLCGGAPGVRAGGVAFPERAMRGGTGVAGSRHLAWSGLNSPARPGCHPTYLPPAVAQVPRGWVGTWGLSHFGEWGGDQAPSPAKAPARRSPTQLGFRRKKGRKEAAGRPCPVLGPRAGETEKQGRGTEDSLCLPHGSGDSSRTRGAQKPSYRYCILHFAATLKLCPRSPPKGAQGMARDAEAEGQGLSLPPCPWHH